MKLKKLYITTGFLVSLSASLILFQNCGHSKFDTAMDKLNSSDIVTTTFVHTTMNTPVTFTANHDASYKNTSLTFNSDTPQNGDFTTVNASDVKVTFTPAFGFRGRHNAEIVVHDNYGGQVKLQVIVDVDNSLSNIEPSLAVRGIGCIQCHSNVASNIVTDFGLHGNGKSIDYTFGISPNVANWNSGSPYGDHDNRLHEINMIGSKSFYVPKNAAVPSVVHTATGANTIADYVRGQIAVATEPATKLSTVIEKDSIYIGAPSAALLMDTFKFSGVQRFKYYRNDNGSINLSGIKDEGTFFRNNGTLSCEGDLAINGTLYLENLNLQSKTGCRIYVVGSVFIYGPITYLNTEAQQNLQITSSKTISLGLGAMKKNGTFCDPNSSWAVSGPNDPNWSAASSLKTRYTDMWTTPMSYVRINNNPVVFGQGVLADADMIQAKLGTLYDATCRPETRAVNYEHLLLNAPIIHSRYTGNFKGTIIAEYTLMSLGSLFKFEFDPIFKEVSVLPFISSDVYLDVK